MARKHVSLKRLRRTISLAALASSGMITVACNRVDPLSVMENNNGVALVDAMVGSDGRIICLLSTRTDACSPNTAHVYVRGIPRFGALRARWKEQNVVEVSVFGGEIIRCRNTLEGADIRIVLRHVPTRQGDDEWDESDTRAFDSVPDSCR